jgi:hypothetical protein
MICWEGGCSYYGYMGCADECNKYHDARGEVVMVVTPDETLWRDSFSVETALRTLWLRASMWFCSVYLQEESLAVVFILCGCR